LAVSAKQIDCSGEVLADQPIRWCCIDRLSWHEFTGHLRAHPGITMGVNVAVHRLGQLHSARPIQDGTVL
jgi:hypothetical protein